jgi:DNA-binding response OmpR family regulator
MSEIQPHRTILVIDDDPDVVSYLESVLTDNGYTVVTAADGGEGLRLMRERRPDLVCLDIAMPEPSGVRVYREMCDDPELSHIPVVMITGVLPQFKEFIHHRKRVPPPAGYIQKPFDVEELVRTVEGVLSVPIT